MIGGADAGAKLVRWYDIANQHFPILRDSVQILGDTPVNSFGLAWYRGLDRKGTPGIEDDEPRFQVRDDIDVDTMPYVGFHEAGHAFQEIVARAIALKTGSTFEFVFDEIRRRYWEFRGFPGVWMDGQLKAINGGGWPYFPDESFADAFAQGMLLLYPVPGYVTGEWTHNYGVNYSWQMRPQILDFMRQLQTEAGGSEVTDEEFIEKYNRLIKPGVDNTVIAIKDRLSVDAHHTHDTSEPK
jgi:hypothetical protein